MTNPTAFPRLVTDTSEGRPPNYGKLVQNALGLSSVESDVLITLGQVVKFEAGTQILRSGDRSPGLYLVLEGIIRQYLSQEGKDTTVYLAPEGGVVGGYDGLLKDGPTLFSLQSLEKTSCLFLNRETIKGLERDFPSWQRLARSLAEAYYLCSVERMSLLQTKPARLRVRAFLKTPQAKLLSRVSQYHLASYLGLEPETFSRLRQNP